MSKLALEEQISALATLSPAQLREKWHSLYGAAAPSLSADLLRLGLAYRIQETALGGIPAPVRRELDGHAGAMSHASTLKAGTRLMRSWHERTLSVTVTEAGFDFDGKEWASLTAIATSVTGVQISGPRFFGIGRHARP